MKTTWILGLLLACSVAVAQPATRAPTGAAAAAPAPGTGAKGASAVPAAPALPPGVIRDCPTCPELVIVPAGVFTLGTSASAAEVDAERGEAPPQPVTLSRPFALGRYEVTVGQFREFVAATQYAPNGDCRVASGGAWTRLPDHGWQDPGFATAPVDEDPAVCVSWDDAKAYADWLARATGQKYRLPSETEWEYAARGGTTTPRYFGDHDSDEAALLSVACDYANVYDTSAVIELGLVEPNARCSDGHTYVAAVGSFKPNAFDLHDMIGNAREWVQDCYTATYTGRPLDGRPWEWAGGCELRGVRGGSWASRPSAARAAARGAEPQSLRQADLGFRVARDL
jgi:formylglycine-generating enzyme required for sulfatase activity